MSDDLKEMNQGWIDCHICALLRFRADAYLRK